MADPASPTVPNAAGVPVLGAGATTPSTGTAASADGSNTITVAVSPSWGIVDSSGNSIFPSGGGPDSYYSVGDDKAFNIPNYPVDSGGFESYNKAEKPANVRLVVMKMGAAADLQAFRQVIRTYLASVELLTIMTPGWTFRRYNMTEAAVERGPEKGAGLLQMTLTFTEVRTDATTAFTSSATASPSGADTVSIGAVQTSTPTGAQTPASSPQ